MELIKYNLFLDDIRDPNSGFMAYEKRLIYDGYKWEVVRNYAEFVAKIEELGIPDFVSYDHDLADEHYTQEMYESIKSYENAIRGTKEKTGLECAQYLCEKLNNKPHPPYIVHSQNPVGKLRIENYIKQYNDSNTTI